MSSKALLHKESRTRSLDHHTTEYQLKTSDFIFIEFYLETYHVTVPFTHRSPADREHRSPARSSSKASVRAGLNFAGIAGGGGEKSAEARPELLRRASVAEALPRESRLIYSRLALERPRGLAGGRDRRVSFCPA